MQRPYINVHTQYANIRYEWRENKAAIGTREERQGTESAGSGNLENDKSRLVHVEFATVIKFESEEEMEGT